MKEPSKTFTGGTLTESDQPKAVDHLVFLAEPFGFGPISSSISVVRQLKALNPAKKIFFLGAGTSFHLAVSSGVFDDVYFCETLSAEALLTCNPAINETNCLIIANTSPSAVTTATKAGFKTIFIDTLFWMWKELPVSPANVERYYIENFHCLRIDIDRFGYSEKFSIIPPLIDISIGEREVQHPFLLVSFGGIDSNLYDFPIFYEKLIGFISGSKTLLHFNILICGGGKKFRNEEFKSYEHSHLKIACLAPHEYISCLKSADLVIASAGLHSFYENYFLKKNVMFLPPQSYSQYLQLKYIIKNFGGVTATNFEHLQIMHELREYMPDEERINEVKRTNQMVVDPEAFSLFLEVFERFCRNELHTTWSLEKTSPEKNLNGPLILAENILSLINY